MNFLLFKETLCAEAVSIADGGGELNRVVPLPSGFSLSARSAVSTTAAPLLLLEGAKFQGRPVFEDIAYHM